MKKNVLIAVILLLIAVITVILLIKKERQETTLVKIRGEALCTNLVKSNLAWMTSVNPDKITAIPANENDLLFISSSESLDNYCVLKFTDQPGNQLNVKFDGFKTYLDDSLVSINIGEDEKSLGWLGTCKPEDIRKLKSVIISDTIPTNYWKGIHCIGKNSGHPGVVLDGETDRVGELLETIDPAWLYCTDNKMNSPGSLIKLENLEVLGIDATDFNAGEISKLTKLHSLILKGLNSGSQIKLPVNIYSLGIMDSEIKNLDFLEKFTWLRELNINGCSSLYDIEALKNLTDLRVLNLIESDSIPDLSPLSKLRKLKWFAPPWNISQQDFDAVIKNNPAIETLILFKCHYINNLQSLKALPNISNVTLIETSVPPDSLKQLKNLDYLAYSFDMEKDSLKLVQLQKEMPSTLIVPAEPFCLGTGWLLFFLPAMLIVVVMLKTIKFKHGWE